MSHLFCCLSRRSSLLPLRRGARDQKGIAVDLSVLVNDD